MILSSLLGLLIETDSLDNHLSNLEEFILNVVKIFYIRFSPSRDRSCWRGACPLGSHSPPRPRHAES